MFGDVLSYWPLEIQILGTDADCWAIGKPIGSQSNSPVREALLSHLMYWFVLTTAVRTLSSGPIVLVLQSRYPEVTSSDLSYVAILAISGSPDSRMLFPLPLIVVFCWDLVSRQGAQNLALRYLCHGSQ